jgi:hypothetical protein
MFKENEIAILNEKCKGLPDKIGERCVVLGNRWGGMYNYDCEFDDGSILRVRESELNKASEIDQFYMSFIFTGNELIYSPTMESVKIIKVNKLVKLKKKPQENSLK